MKILFAGGGSGGHVTPLRAIAKEVQKINSSASIAVITDRGFYTQTAFLFQSEKNIKLTKIFSGKFRRYTNKSLAWHLTHLPTVLKNIRDIFFIALGVMQALLYFLRSKPDVVFCKGGYVCVPVGIAARVFNVPLIIHDSDTHPGLTNRFLAGWARRIATGMPTKYYTYEPAKMVYTGIPVNQDFKPFSQSDVAKAKKQLSFDPEKPVVLVTGGGTGSKELNRVVSAIAPNLLVEGIQLAHITGKGKSKTVIIARAELGIVEQESWQVHEFAEMLPYVTAADLIITRAGATALQEFANAKKPVIIVPSPYLTGGHQVKNATLFAEHKAAAVLQEADLVENSDLLADATRELLTDKKAAEKIASALHTNFAKPDAARELAHLIME